MGSAKREIERIEEARAAATKIALSVGLLKRCEYCDCVIDPLNNNFEDAYRLGNKCFSDGDEAMGAFADRREMTDLVQDICNQYGEECDCDHRAGKD